MPVKNRTDLPIAQDRFTVRHCAHTSHLLWIRHLGIGLFFVGLFCLSGCIQTLQEEIPSPLRPIKPSANSCMVDLFFVRFPISRADANGSLWDTIDEQLFTPELRKQLAKNGFRVGVSGNRIPTELSQLLEIEGRPLLGITQEVKADELIEAPNVIRAQQRLQPGRRQEVICSDIYPCWPLLESNKQGVCGETLNQAQAIIGLRTYPTADGSVKIRLQPEVHYGEIRRRINSSGGVVRFEEGRNRREFTEMTLETTLSPGQMLVLTCLPEQSRSLGWRFFTRDDKGTTEQRMLVIRLSHVQHTGIQDTSPEMDVDENAEKFGVELFHEPPQPSPNSDETPSEPRKSETIPQEAGGKSTTKKRTIRSASELMRDVMTRKKTEKLEKTENSEAESPEDGTS
ncbi:MAG: hypothetical protein PHE53_03400 [Thermoguttaceae bacterium]|nr:hypothetical protein [Thermoguttaceae bacterium]